jgi:hypothetical protein
VRGPQDGGVGGHEDDVLVSRAAALGWDPATPVRVVVGAAPAGRQQADRLAELRRRGTGTDPGGAGHAAPGRTGPGRTGPGRTGPGRTGPGRTVLAAVQGERLVLLLPDPPDADRDPADATGLGALLDRIPAAFGPGPVVVGPAAADLSGAHASAREALAGLRAAAGRPDAPRPVAADDLLPERALAGDPAAHRRLVDAVVTPLAAAGGELLTTLAAYVEGGGGLEACARALYVHPNTVRYRLRRVAEVTGHSPTDARDAFVLHTALVVSRLMRAPGTDAAAEQGRDARAE